MCGRDAMETQYNDVIVFIEEGQGYLQSVNAEAVSKPDLLEPLESRLTAIRMGRNMTREEKIRKLHWSLCEEKQRILMKSLERAWNANSMEDLSRSYGKGRLVTRQVQLCTSPNPRVCRCSRERKKLVPMRYLSLLKGRTCLPTLSPMY